MQGHRTKQQLGGLSALLETRHRSMLQPKCRLMRPNALVPLSRGQKSESARIAYAWVGGLGISRSYNKYELLVL